MSSFPNNHYWVYTFLNPWALNQNEILKRGMTWTEQKPKGTTFKVHSWAIANSLNIDLIHQWGRSNDVEATFGVAQNTPVIYYLYIL